LTAQVGTTSGRREALEEEREVDFARYARLVLSRWWLVLAAVIVGAIVGFLVARTGGSTYSATATMYLGTPLSVNGGGLPLTLTQNSTAISEIARSESVVDSVAAKAGMTPTQLRNGISIQQATASKANQTPPPIATLTVRGRNRHAVAKAANLLAALVVQRISGYANVKIAALKQQESSQQKALDAVEKELTTLSSAAGKAGSLSSLERLTLTSLVASAQARQSDLISAQTQTRQLLTLAENVERGKILASAAAHKISARSRKTSVVVGAFIGLLIGIVLALAWGPLFGGRRRPA